jgi:hypothetical protein
MNTACHKAKINIVKMRMAKYKFTTYIHNERKIFVHQWNTGLTIISSLWHDIIVFCNFEGFSWEGGGAMNSELLILFFPHLSKQTEKLAQ